LSPLRFPALGQVRWSRRWTLGVALLLLVGAPAAVASTPEAQDLLREWSALHAPTLVWTPAGAGSTPFPGRVLAHLLPAERLGLSIIPAVTSPSTSEGIPYPVIMVPGWGDRAEQFDLMKARLMESGWPEEWLVPLDFVDPVGSNEAHAQELAERVESLLAVVAMDRVDVVAFSMGGLAVRHYLRFGDGEAMVRRAIFLGTPHQGTVVAHLAWGDGGREMVPGSSFLEQLNVEREGKAGVEMAAIQSLLDSRVIPSSHGVLEGAENYEVCCPGHQGLLENQEVFSIVEGFLRHGAHGVPERYRRVEDLRPTLRWPSGIRN